MGVLAVFLVGFMGSGKTTVGRELARRLGWDFIDLDSRLESRERKSIPEIFQQDGESAFRLAETSVLRELTGSLQRSSVVALGGGAFAQPTNRSLVARWPTVFLEASLDELWRRSSEDAVVRPLRRDREQFSRLYEERVPSYRQATITVVTSDKDIPSICREIEGTLSLGEFHSADTGGTGPDSASSGQGGQK